MYHRFPEGRTDVRERQNRSMDYSSAVLGTASYVTSAPPLENKNLIFFFPLDMILELDSNVLIITLMCADLAMGLWRCVQDYRTGKKLEWLVNVLRAEHEASVYQRA